MFFEIDQLAVAAMQGLLAGSPDRYWDKGQLKAELLAEDAYDAAEAMAKEGRFRKVDIPVPPVGPIAKANEEPTGQAK